MIKRTNKFPSVKGLDQELDSIVKNANTDISTANDNITANTKSITTEKQSSAALATLFVAVTSAGSPTRELKSKTVTLIDGTTLNVLVTD
jgi:division protein CdvB (Snf7/Vps24/ESCRT-III family)